jgi:hypothetical protein
MHLCLADPSQFVADNLMNALLTSEHAEEEETVILLSV